MTGLQPLHLLVLLFLREELRIDSFVTRLHQSGLEILLMVGQHLARIEVDIGALVVHHEVVKLLLSRILGLLEV